MTTLFVTYAGDAGTRFDREHYVDVHLPLVTKAWAPCGMKAIGAFFPAGDGGGTVAVCVMQFGDEAALAAAVTSPATAEVMADVVNFTDAKPVQSRAQPL